MHPDEFNNIGPIDNLRELSEVITAVVNHILVVATENTSTGQWYIDYDDVSDIITEEDYLTYFDLITSELMDREEVLDLDTSDHTFDIVCGLAWCKNYELLPDEDFEYGYEELRPAPSMARLAEIGQKAVDHLVLEDTSAKFQAEDLGISAKELEYTRNYMGLDRNADTVHQLLPVMSNTLITAESYENLVISSAMQHEDLKATGNKDPICVAFKVCVNSLGQIIDPTMSAEEKALYRAIFENRSSLNSHCYGAMVNSQPTIVLCRALDSPLEDPYQRHAVTAMTAGYASAMLREANVHITYGRGTGEDGKDEIMAFLPATTSMEHIGAFDRKFTAVMDTLPHTWNAHWAAAQYDALLTHVTEKMAGDQHIAPWTRSNPEQAAIFACESLGKYIGEHQYEIDQAKLTHNTEKLMHLSKKLDVTTCPKTRDRVLSDGIFASDRDLSRRLRLYAEEPGRQDPFLVPKGQLLLAMEKMGYEPGFSPMTFMQGYSPDDAREVRSVVEGLPRLSLFQQIRSAEQRKSQPMDPGIGPDREKEKGREI